MITVAGASAIIFQARGTERETWRLHVANLSTTLAEHTRQVVQSADLVLQSIQARVEEAGIDSDADLRHEMGTKAIFDTIRDKIAGIPQIDVATIVASNGDVVNFSRAWPPRAINLSDRDYHRVLRADPFFSGAFLSVPVENRATGDWTFYLSRPIRTRDGQFLGAVIVGLSSQYFQDFFNAINPSAEAIVSLFRSDGTLLARAPLGEEQIGSSFQDRSAFKDIMMPGVTAGAAFAEGRLLPNGDQGPSRIVAPRRLTGFPLISNVTVNEDVYLANWRTNARLIAVLAGGLVGILLVLTVLLVRLLLRNEQAMVELTCAQHAAQREAAANAVLVESLQASETKLRDKSHTLEVTLDNMGQGLLMITADRVIAVCNRRAVGSSARGNVRHLRVRRDFGTSNESC